MNNDLKQQDVFSINLIDIFSFVWAKKFISLLVVVVCVAAGFFYEQFFISPKYVSQSKMVILETSETGKISSTDLAISTYLVIDYSEMVTDRTVLEEVIKELKLDTTAEQLRGSITVNNPENSRILEINVATSNPKLSQKIGDRICHVAKTKIVDVLGVDKVNIFSEASLPKNDTSLSRRSAMLIGLAIGILIVIGLAVLFACFDDKVKSSEDIEKYIGLCTLATIPYNSSNHSKRRKRKVVNN